MDHATLKFLHVASACVFVGNNLVTPLWKFTADRTRNPRVIAFSQRLVALTDIVFTSSSVVVLLATGHLMAASMPGLWDETWFVAAYACFASSGLIWLAVLLPIQSRQSKLARAFASATNVPAEYWKLAARWNVAGAVATLLPLASLFLMVAKR